MGAKTEALARQFEEKARDAVATLEKLGAEGGRRNIEGGHDEHDG